MNGILYFYDNMMDRRLVISPYSKD